MASTSIIQWNCRGFRANFNEISLLINSFEPIALCLQELLLSDTYAFNNRHYNLLTNLPPTTSNNRPQGGAGILVRKTIPHSVIPLNTTLQAMACRTSIPQPITLCSIYLPPPSAWTHADLISIILQLPSPVLLLGDFNAHDSLWGCTTSDKKGREVVNFLLKTNLCLMNTKAATYIHPATGSRSSIDLAICDPALYLDFSWQVHDDLCGSDHLPIILKHLTGTVPTSPQHWNLVKANWGEFTSLCLVHLKYDDLAHLPDPIEGFNSAVLSIAEKTIPKTSSKPKKHNKPWFDDECKTAVSERKKALQVLASKVNAVNLTNLRVYRAKARRTINLSKRNCWQSYVSKLNSQTPMKKIWSMIRRISGRPTTTPTNHLLVNSTSIEQPTEIADTLASTFAHNSSPDHYTQKFQRFKTCQERHQIKFTSDNLEPYNLPFSMTELHTAVHKAPRIVRWPRQYTLPDAKTPT